MKAEKFGRITVRSEKRWHIDGELPIRVRARCERCDTEEVIEATVKMSNDGDGLLQVITGSYSIDDKCKVCTHVSWLKPIPLAEDTVLDLTPYQDENSRLSIPWDQ